MRRPLGTGIFPLSPNAIVTVGAIDAVGRTRPSVAVSQGAPQPHDGRIRAFQPAAISDISQPYELDDRISINIGASVGIALASEHGLDLESLMSAADTALYEAKATGKSRCIIAPRVVQGAAIGRGQLSKAGQIH